MAMSSCNLQPPKLTLNARKDDATSVFDAFKKVQAVVDAPQTQMGRASATPAMFFQFRSSDKNGECRFGMRLSFQDPRRAQRLSRWWRRPLRHTEKRAVRGCFETFRASANGAVGGLPQGCSPRMSRAEWRRLLCAGLVATAGCLPLRDATITSVDSIAFASCNKHDEPQPFWADIAAVNPDLFLWLVSRNHNRLARNRVQVGRMCRLVSLRGTYLAPRAT